jgi:hypothetical protein
MTTWLLLQLLLFHQCRARLRFEATVSHDRINLGRAPKLEKTFQQQLQYREAAMITILLTQLKLFPDVAVAISDACCCFCC